MKQLKNMIGICIYSNGFVSRDKRYLNYKLINDKILYDFHIELPRYERPIISNKIVATSMFTNGYMRIQTDNGEFAYIREKDGVLLEHRYDIASDFNEYGFAMIGKNNSLSWIDSEFNNIGVSGNFTFSFNNDKDFSFIDKTINLHSDKIEAMIYDGDVWKKLEELKKISYELHKRNNPILFVGKKTEKVLKLKSRNKNKTLI